ncbi:MAG: DUF5003 domain-containing protein [Bacteroidaceae bacterium]|nr:DUF5003 domain-containing protein [Bacteroidaceae bacterium]
MKYISKLYIACLAVALSCLVSACVESEELDSAGLSFTELRDLDMAALDSCESIIGSFELTANGDWSLYSDKMWVKLSLERDGWYFNDLKGEAGVYTVYVKVTNDARDFNDATATITLDADGKTQCVATMERKGLERIFALMSDGQKIERIEIGPKAEITFELVTNFECALLSLSGCEWLEEPEKVDNGYKLKVLESLVPHPYVLDGTATFGNEDGSLLFEVPVVYKDPVTMVIVNDNDYTPWNWDASIDGKTFVQQNSSLADDSVKIVVENAFVYKLSCLNYEFKLVSAQMVNGKLEKMDADESWIIATRSENDSTQVSVSVKPLSTVSRHGYQFAVPVEQYDVFIESLAASNDVSEFTDKYTSYIMLQVQQCNNDGFIITDADGVAMNSIVEEEYYEWLSSEFSITDLTTCNLEPGKSYTIETKLTRNEWKGNFALRYKDYLDNNTKLRLKNWGNPEAILDDNGYYILNIKVPASLNQEVVLWLYTQDIVNIKALVIRPVAQ